MRNLQRATEILNPSFNLTYVDLRNEVGMRPFLKGLVDRRETEQLKDFITQQHYQQQGETKSASPRGLASGGSPTQTRNADHSTVPEQANANLKPAEEKQLPEPSQTTSKKKKRQSKKISAQVAPNALASVAQSEQPIAGSFKQGDMPRSATNIDATLQAEMGSSAQVGAGNTKPSSAGTPVATRGGAGNPSSRDKTAGTTTQSSQTSLSRNGPAGPANHSAQRVGKDAWRLTSGEIPWAPREGRSGSVGSRASAGQGRKRKQSHQN